MSIFAGGEPALKRTIEFKMHLLSRGYDAVDICMDKERELFCIAHNDNINKQWFNKAQLGGGLDLIAFPVGKDDEKDRLGKLEAEHKLIKYIRFLSTEDNRTGKGIGTTLVSRAVASLKNKKCGISPIYLNATKVSYNFYDRFGFINRSNDTSANYGLDAKAKELLELIDANANKVLAPKDFNLTKTQTITAKNHIIHTSHLISRHGK